MKACLAAVWIAFAANGAALTPDEEARAQALMREIRCVACENEPISQSASDIAANMREKVHALVAEGKSDREVRDWFAARYGEFVLFRPKARGAADWLLWGAPFAFLLGGAGLALRMLTRHRAAGRETVEAIAPETLQDD